MTLTSSGHAAREAAAATAADTQPAAPVHRTRAPEGKAAEHDRGEQPGFAGHDERIRYFVNGAPRQNFGDYLPELIAKELLLQPRVDADAYRLIGSVIHDEWIRRDLRRSVGVEDGIVAFWGCGMREAQSLPTRTMRLCRFHGVRGPLTRELLGLPEDTVIGDPGLLAPLLHTPSCDAATAGRTLCLPHVQDARDAEALRGLAGADAIVRPEIAASEAALRAVLDRIADARFVLTASLHGAIVACAYGTPFAFWDNGHLDVPFKWQDFAASVGVPCEFARDVAAGQALYRSVLAPRLRRPPLAPLLDVCPFAVRPAALVRALVIDGTLAADAGVADVQAALTALASAQPAALQRLLADAAARRAARARLSFALRADAGGAVEALKAVLRRARGVY